jgi:cell division transport system permease protein
MSRFAFLVREALVNLRRNALVVTGAVLAVFISLTLAFGALVVNELLRVNTLAWQEGVHIVAFLKDPEQGGLDVDGQLALRASVEAWEEVKAVRYVDKAEAYEEFKELFASRPELIDVANPAKLPTSLRIELVDISTYRDVQFRLQSDPAVRDVRSFGEQIESLSSLSRVLNLLGIGLALVLGVSAVILIANTIRMAIYARRDEVSIMKLVGASNWFIRVPFLLEGLIEGVLGAGLAVLTVWVTSQNLQGLGESIRLLTFAIPTQFFLRWGVVFVLFGALAGVLGSLLGLSRYLREADGARESDRDTALAGV